MRQSTQIAPALCIKLLPCSSQLKYYWSVILLLASLPTLRHPCMVTDHV